MKPIKAFSAIALLLISLSAGAQTANYWKNSLELNGGLAVSRYTITTDIGYATNGILGWDAGLRYTRFCSDNWGAYIQVNPGRCSSPDIKFYDTLNRADLGTFRYGPGYPGYSYIVAPAVVGAVARYYFQDFTLLLRAGFGAAYFDPSAYTYTRERREGYSGTELVTVDHVANVGWDLDYLIDKDEDYFIRNSYALGVANASAQICRYIGYKVFLSAEAGLDFYFGQASTRTTVLTANKLYKPSTLLDAISYYLNSDNWKTDIVSSTVFTTTQNLRPHLYLQFGIGFNFGQ